MLRYFKKMYSITIFVVPVVVVVLSTATYLSHSIRSLFLQDLIQNVFHPPPLPFDITLHPCLFHFGVHRRIHTYLFLLCGAQARISMSLENDLRWVSERAK